MAGVVQCHLIYVIFSISTGVLTVYQKESSEITPRFLSMRKLKRVADVSNKCSPADKKTGPEVHYKHIAATSFSVSSSIV